MEGWEGEGGYEKVKEEGSTWIFVQGPSEFLVTPLRVGGTYTVHCTRTTQDLDCTPLYCDATDSVLR